MKHGIGLALALLLAVPGQAKALRLIAIDVEGGAANLYITPRPDYKPPSYHAEVEYHHADPTHRQRCVGAPFGHRRQPRGPSLGMLRWSV